MKTLLQILDLSKEPNILPMLIDVNDQVEALYNRMFEKYYNGDALPDWNEKSFFGGGNASLYKSFIRTLLLEGKKVKTGYRTSTKVRGAKTFYIYWKD